MKGNYVSKMTLVGKISCLAVGLLSISFPASVARAQGQPTSPDEINLKDCVGAIRNLRAGTAEGVVDNRISPGEVQCYRIVLRANQYMHVEVMQRGVDVIVQLLTAAGKKIGAPIDSPNFRDGLEPISEASDSDTDYVIAVKSQDQQSDRQPIYDIAIKELRDATDDDRNYVQAERAYQQGRLQLLPPPQLDIPAAISNLERARSLLVPFKSKPKIWPEVLDQLALAYSIAGKPFEAVGTYEAESDFYLTAKDFNNEAGVLTTIGVLYFNTGQAVLSRNYYQKALTVGATDTRTVANAKYNLGVVLTVLGQYKSALDTLLEAKMLYDAARKEGPDAENEYQQSFPHVSKAIGLAYAMLGDHITAMDFYRQGLAAAEPGGKIRDDQAAEAAAYLHLYKGFSAYGLNDKQTAENETNVSLRIFQQIGNNRGAANALVNIGFSYYEAGNLDQALSLLKRAADLQTNDPIGLAYTKTNIARILIDKGEPNEALKILSEALKLRGGDKSGEAITLYAMALAHVHLNELNAALSEIEAARTIVEDIRRSTVNPELRALFRGSVDKIYKLYVDILMRQGRTPEAFEFEDNARAAELSETLLAARVNLLTSLDAATLRTWQDLNDQVLVLAGKRQLLGREMQKSPAAVELNTQIDKKTAQLRTITEKVLGNPSTASLLKPTPLSTQQVRELLDSETTLLEYSLGDERSYVWAVSKTEDTLTGYPLPGRKKIDELGKKLRELLTSPRLDQDSLRRYQQLSTELTSMLLAPVSNEIRGKRILIVADGILQYIPFSALPEPNKADGQPLIIEHEIVNAPSASALAALRFETTSRREAPSTLALFADPVYVRAQNANRTGSAGSEGAKGENALRPLAFAKDEIKEIRSAFAKLGAGKNLSPQTGYDATRQNAISATVQNFRIIHYSAHGVADDSRPEASGIYLSRYDRQGREIPNFVGLSDVYSLKLSADLVVLSACETALGKEVRGEGILGLTRGFMYAGSATVVSSLWEVNEFHTATLMGLFYKGMFEDRQPPTAALRMAQREMWRQKLPPYYWAGFNLYGEWRLKQPF